MKIEINNFVKTNFVNFDAEYSAIKKIDFKKLL